MGNWFTTGQAVDPETSQRAQTQREAESMTVTAQHGGVFNRPQLSGVSAGGNINITVSNTYGTSPDRTDEADAVSTKNKASRREIPQSNVPAEERLFLIRTQFVSRVSDPNLDWLLDKLLEHQVINDDEMQSARAKLRADKARHVIDTVRKKGTEASSVLIAALCEVDPHLSRELKLS